jgi:hypothetical protein
MSIPPSGDKPLDSLTRQFLKYTDTKTYRSDQKTNQNIKSCAEKIINELGALDPDSKKTYLKTHSAQVLLIDRTSILNAFSISRFVRSIFAGVFGTKHVIQTASAIRQVQKAFEDLKPDWPKLALFASASSMTQKLPSSPIKTESLGGAMQSDIIDGLQDVLEEVMTDSRPEIHDEDRKSLEGLQKILKQSKSISRQLENLNGSDKDTPSKITHLSKQLEQDVKNLEPGSSLVIPYSICAMKDGHAIILEITKQKDGLYSYTVYNTGLAIKHHKKDGDKFFPFSRKDVSITDLNQAHFKPLIELTLSSDAEEALANSLDAASLEEKINQVLESKFDTFYSSIEKLGPENISVKSYKDQGLIGSCTYKSLSKLIHKRLGENYEKIKILMHQKILDKVKEQLKQSKVSHDLSKNSAFLRIDPSKKQDIKSSLDQVKNCLGKYEKLSMSDNQILSLLELLKSGDQETPSKEFLFLTAYLFEREIEKTQLKLNARYDQSYILDLVKTNPKALKKAALELKQDPDFVKKCVELNGLALEHADKFLNDSDMAFIAIRQNPQAVVYISESLKKDKEFAENVVKDNGMLLEFFPDLVTVEEVVKAAVKENGAALKFAPFFQSNFQIVKDAVMQNGLAIQFAPKFNDNKQILLTAAAQNGLSSKHFDVSLDFPEKDYKEIALAACRQNGLALQHFPTLSKDLDVVSCALNQNKEAFDFVDRKLKKDPHILNILEKRS